MSFDGFGQFELDERAMQVVTGIFHFKIYIACQMVGEETQPQFERDQTDGVEHVVVIGCREEGAGLGEITFQDR